MNMLSTMEMRTIDGGASKYVYCPICNQKVTVGLISRLFYKNRRIEASLTAEHGLYSAWGTPMTAHIKRKWGK